MLPVWTIVPMVSHKTTCQQVLTTARFCAANGASTPHGAAACTVLPMKLLRINAYGVQRPRRHVFGGEGNAQGLLKILRCQIVFIEYPATFVRSQRLKIASNLRTSAPVTRICNEATPYIANFADQFP